MRKVLLTIAALALALLLWFAIGQVTEETTLSAKQVESRVATLYDATVEHSIKKGTQYFVAFEKNQSKYEVTVNEQDGGFSQLTLITDGTVETPPPVEQPEPDNEPAPTPTPEPVIILTEQQAINAALAKFPGTADDADFEQTADGGYYLIEVETTDESEVTVQIHAITGKIMTFTFDD